MISKKRRHKYHPPTTGRAAFRGILHPLILGGQSIAPTSTTATSNFDPYSQATVTVPSTDDGPPQKLRDACELSATEKAWCDINSTFSWCDKAGLFSDDPKCVPNNIKCPPSQKWLDISNDPFSIYRDFTKSENIINGIDGMCVDEAIEKREDIWVKTRGCKYTVGPFRIQDTPLKSSPCPWPQFKGLNTGESVTINGSQFNFLGWIPERP